MVKIVITRKDLLREDWKHIGMFSDYEIWAKNDMRILFKKGKKSMLYHFKQWS
jgi:hypothetical protein